MKISFIGSYPPQRDGIAIHNSRFVAALLREGHDVRVFSFRASEKKNVCAVLSRNNPFSYINLFLKVNKYNPQKILISHEYAHFNFLFFPLLVFLLKMRSKKLNIMMHTVAPYDSGWKKFAFNLLYLSFFIFTDTLFLFTKNSRKKLLLTYKGVKPNIQVIPHLIQKRIGKPKKLNSRKINLLMFGFIHPGKGVDIAIRAVKGMQNATLKIVGSINPYASKKSQPELLCYLNKIRSMANSAKNVQFIENFATEKEKARLFSEADFVLLPYRYIEQSGILTEVWSFRRIPVASDVPAFRKEIGKSYGVLFSKEDLSGVALRSSINLLARRPVLRKKLLSNIERLAKERSFDANVGRILRLMS